MAAEIVVIVQNQDAGVRFCLAVEMRGRQAADAATNDDKVVLFADTVDRPLRATRACIAAQDPSWLPRNPVRAGG